jgi:hypothetical protein
MKSRLEELKFKVDYEPDVKTADDFEASIRKFRQKVSKGDWVIIYFSGHGFSYGAGNYLVPTEMPIPVKREELPLHAVSVDGLIGAVARRDPGLIMVFLDACRSVGNILTDAAAHAPVPDGRGLRADVHYRKVAHPIYHSTASSRIAEVISATGSIPGAGQVPEGLVQGYSKPITHPLKVNYSIFYPTDAGALSEGTSATDRLSTFTHALFNRIGTAGKSFLSVWLNIATDVATESAQDPHIYGNSKTDPYFLPTEDLLKDQREAWRSILGSRRPVEITKFLYRYSVSLHAAACRLWLDEAQAAPYAQVSPSAVDRAWDTANDGRAGILRLEKAPLVFERQLEQSQEQSLDKLSNAELGIVTTLTTENVPVTTRALEFYLQTLDDHKTAVTTQDLKGLKSPNAAAASERIPSGTVLEINDVSKVSDTLGYVSATVQGETSPLFIRVETPALLLNILGYPLKEIIAAPRPDSIPDLVDPAPIRGAIAELKNQGWEITWVSLSTAAPAPTDSEYEQDARLLRLANAEYIAKNEGVAGRRITSVSGKDDFSGNGVRVRFFGVKKN